MVTTKLEEKLEDLIPPLFGDEIQELEYIYQDLYQINDEDVMTGDNLLAIATLVGQETLSVTESILRRLIKAKAIQKQSKGQYMDIYLVIKYLTDSDSMQLLPAYPAGFAAYVDGDVPSGWEDYYRKFINDTGAACVSLFRLHDFPVSGDFILGSGGSAGNDPYGVAYTSYSLDVGKLTQRIL